jgi:hypothetical protein
MLKQVWETNKQKSVAVLRKLWKDPILKWCLILPLLVLVVAFPFAIRDYQKRAFLEDVRVLIKDADVAAKGGKAREAFDRYVALLAYAGEGSDDPEVREAVQSAKAGRDRFHLVLKEEFERERLAQQNFIRGIVVIVFSIVVVAGVVSLPVFLLGFFKKRPPVDPPTEKQRRYVAVINIDDSPTEKQRRYAAVIGIDVPPTMTKAELSDAITNAERRNPALAERREQIKVKVREREFGKELVELEDRWNCFADKGGYILAIYTRGKKTIVDVLSVNEAFINDRGKLKLGVVAPKVVKDRVIGDCLDWDGCFELPIESLLYHEPVDPGFYTHDGGGYGPGNRAYQKLVERGLKIARKMNRNNGPKFLGVRWW